MAARPDYAGFARAVADKHGITDPGFVTSLVADLTLLYEAGIRDQRIGTVAAIKASFVDPKEQALADWIEARGSDVVVPK